MPEPWMIFRASLKIFQFHGRLLPLPRAGVRPGAKFVRKLELDEGSKIKVKTGPEGLSYALKSKEIRWLIPRDHERGVIINVVLTITSPEGKESFHKEKIVIQ